MVKGMSRDLKKRTPRLIRCKTCGLPGGTLIKTGDDYVHQDKQVCRILQLRKVKDG